MPDIIKLISDNKDSKLLEDIFNYFEKVSNCKDEHSINIFSTTVLEILGNDKQILKSAQKYIGEKTKFLQIEADRSLGRIKKFEANDLKLTKRENRLPHNSDTPGKLEGEHEGHLAGDIFGGSPELDNLVSQASNVNLSQYKKLENLWAMAIKEGKDVKVNVEIKYDGDALRPSEFNVKYEIDGKRYRQSVLN